MEPFSVSTTLNQEDWTAYKRAAVLRMQSSVSIWWRVALFALIATIVFSLVWLDLPISGASFVLGGAAAIILLAISYRMNTHSVQNAHREAFLGVSSFEFSSTGIRSARNGVQSSVEWSEIKELVVAADHLTLWFKHPVAFVIPLRDLPLGVSRDDAAARIRLWMASKPGAESAVIANPDSLTLDEWLAQRNSAAPKLVATQGLTAALFRLFILRTPQAGAITGSDRSIAALAFLSLVLWVAIGRIQTGDNAEMYIYNLPALAFIAVALLLLALIFARRSTPNIEFRRALVVVLAVLPVVIVAATLLATFPSGHWVLVAWFLLFTYVTAYATKALNVLSGAKQLGAAFGGVTLCAALWFFTSSYLYLDATVWFNPKAAEDSRDEWRSARDQTESILFNQPERIDQRIEPINRPADAAAVNFFVGFAGFGEQKVFAEEIKLASKTIGERFDIDKRSLLLINDRRDMDSDPLATATNLHYALSRMAKKMNVDQDILFLSLSSHGSAEPELSVSNSALPLNDLTGEALAAALNDSGIKWRVIIISACHSGAFIEYLANPNTVIITASAADKTSFGCSDERDLTYFGEAFYRDALPKSKSLLDAFNSAKASIAEREKKEGVTASDPQVSFGAEIEKKLSESAKAAAAK